MEMNRVEKFNEVSLVLVERPNVLMNMETLISTVNEVVIKTLSEKYGYNAKVVDVMLNSDSEWINQLIQDGKIKMNKTAMNKFVAVFTAACNHYREHFDSINKDMFVNVTNYIKSFANEIIL